MASNKPPNNTECEKFDWDMIKENEIDDKNQIEVEIYIPIEDDTDNDEENRVYIKNEMHSEIHIKEEPDDISEDMNTIYIKKELEDTEEENDIAIKEEVIEENQINIKKEIADPELTHVNIKLEKEGKPIKSLFFNK